MVTGWEDWSASDHSRTKSDHTNVTSLVPVSVAAATISTRTSSSPGSTAAVSLPSRLRTLSSASSKASCLRHSVHCPNRYVRLPHWHFPS